MRYILARTNTIVYVLTEGVISRYDSTKIRHRMVLPVMAGRQDLSATRLKYNCVNLKSNIVLKKNQ